MKKQNLVLAPIALFVFNRPKHTKQVLAALSANPEFFGSSLFIYCDGARKTSDVDKVECTRELVRNLEHPAKTIIEAESNCGLAESVIAGVTDLVTRFGRVIVVEDDLYLSTGFLAHMNAALDKYCDIPQIMQVSGFMFPIQEFAERQENLFLPFISSWGWGTWSRAWNHFDAEAKGWKTLLTNAKLRHKFNVNSSYDYSDMLIRQMTGQLDSWAIRWNWSVFKHGGLVSYPPVSFVSNSGFDGSGSHCRANRFFRARVFALPHNLVFLERIEVLHKDLHVISRALLDLSGSPAVRFLKFILNFFLIIRLKLFILVFGDGFQNYVNLYPKKQP